MREIICFGIVQMFLILLISVGPMHGKALVKDPIFKPLKFKKKVHLAGNNEY